MGKLDRINFMPLKIEVTLREQEQEMLEELEKSEDYRSTFVDPIKFYYSCTPIINERYVNLIVPVLKLQRYLVIKEYTTSEIHIIFRKNINTLSTIIGKITDELDILIKKIDNKLMKINNTNLGTFLNRSVKEFIGCIKTTQIFFYKNYGFECETEISHNSDLLFLIDIYDEYPLLADITHYFLDKISYFINSYSITIPNELHKVIYGFLQYVNKQVNGNKDFDMSNIDLNINTIPIESEIYTGPTKYIEKQIDAYKLDEEMYNKISDYYKSFKELEKICTRSVFGTMFEYADFSKSIKPNGDVPAVICKVIYDFQKNIIKDKTSSKQWYSSVCKSINRTPHQIYNSQRDFRKR